MNEKTIVKKFTSIFLTPNFNELLNFLIPKNLIRSNIVGDWSVWANKYKIGVLTRCARAICKGIAKLTLTYFNLIELKPILSIEIRNNMLAKKKKTDVFVVGDNEDGDSEVAKKKDGLINSLIND